MPWSREKSVTLMAQILPADTEVVAKERKRRRIATAATGLFLRLGYRKTSIEDVARAAGVAKGTVYLYFASKAELLLHAIVTEKAPFAARFLDLLEDPDPHLRLWRYIFETARALPQMPLTTHLAETGNDFEIALAELAPDLAGAVTEQRVDTLERLVRPFVPMDERNALREISERAAILAGLLHALPATLTTTARLGLDPDRAAALLADTLVDGLTRAPLADATGRAAPSPAANRSADAGPDTEGAT